MRLKSSRQIAVLKCGTCFPAVLVFSLFTRSRLVPNDLNFIAGCETFGFVVEFWKSVP